jgi:hypothetical protein
VTAAGGVSINEPAANNNSGDAPAAGGVALPEELAPSVNATWHDVDTPAETSCEVCAWHARQAII